jgi:hypothetical protein
MELLGLTSTLKIYSGETLEEDDEEMEVEMLSSLDGSMAPPGEVLLSRESQMDSSGLNG